MDKGFEKSLYDSLAAVQESLEYLQHEENQELRELVRICRCQITAMLEDRMSCSLSHRIEIFHLSDEDWLRTAYFLAGGAEGGSPGTFQPRNLIDRKFLSLLEYVWQHSSQELFETLLAGLKKWEQYSPENYKGFVSYFSQYPLWGTLDPACDDYSTLRQRVSVLKQHSYDFLWLYRRMEDYLSKRTLYAILANWILLDLEELSNVKSIFSDYWEPDIFPDNHGDILVDVGAFIGDSIFQYVQMYGTGYQKIYAYEISADSSALLHKNVEAMGLHDVIIRRKGVGAIPGKMFVSSSQSDSSANQLSSMGDEQEQVEVVPLDEDIADKVTFIKMDIEGAEQTALLGCERIIREYHPKLAICTYHGYEDIWKIPLIIDSMYPEYKFYMRHYGGNLIPTEFVLLCHDCP